MSVSYHLAVNGCFDRRAFLQNVCAAVGAAALPHDLRAAQADPVDVFTVFPYLNGWLEEFLVPGVAVAFTYQGMGTWAHCKGVADLKTKAAITDDTVFQAASLSKPVFAYAVLTLAGEGKFDLDRPLVSYGGDPFRSRMTGLMASAVPADARLDTITPRMVLRHATGLPNWARGKPLSLAFAPGTKFGYSGEAYTYLQNVVEHVTGEPLERFAQSRVLGPLGMDSSSFVWRDDYDARAAIGHNREGPRQKWRPRQALAAGTLHTTARDYASFLRAVLWPATGNGLNAEWVGKMLAPATRIDRSLSWGLGWGLEKHGMGPFFWQWGDDGEFKAFAMGSRQHGKAAVILTNGANGLRVCRAVIEASFGRKHPLLSFPMLNY